MKGKVVFLLSCFWAVVLLAATLSYQSSSFATPLDPQSRTVVGHRKTDRGWGSSFTDSMEELWSYLIHGHGIRTHEPVYGPGKGETNSTEQPEDELDFDEADGTKGGDNNPGYYIGTPPRLPPRERGPRLYFGKPWGDANTGDDTEMGSDNGDTPGCPAGSENPDPDVPPSPVPEPATLLTFLLGAFSFILARAKKKGCA